jgi:NAD(P)-dependent dehydrogenase (short-subunit alcohol dehydrogenase family)
MLERRLHGQVAIVTGAAGPTGFGRVITLAFIRAGARVAMLDVNQPSDQLNQQRQTLRKKFTQPLELAGAGRIGSNAADVLASGLVGLEIAGRRSLIRSRAG